MYHHRMSQANDHLASLFVRLARLDEERAGILKEIADCLADGTAALAEAAPLPPPPPQAAAPPRRSWPPVTFREQLLNFFNSHPDKVFTIYDVAKHYSITHPRQEQSLRGLLARMKKQGHIRKVAHGRYQALSRS
jgi:hypothetical protein